MGHWCVLHSSQKSKSQDYSFDGSQDDMLLSSSTKPASAYIRSISSTLVSLYCILDALMAEFTKDVWYQRAFTVQFQSDTATLEWYCQMNSMLWYQLCNEYRRCRNVPHLPATGNNIQVEFQMFPLSRLTVKVDQTLQQLNSNCDAWTSAQPCLSISGVPSALEKDLGLRRRHTSSLSLLTSNTSSNNIIHRLYYHNCTVKYTLIHLYDSFTVSTVKLSYQNLIVTLHTHTHPLCLSTSSRRLRPSRHHCSAPVSYQHHHRRCCWKHSAGRIEAQVAWRDHWFQPAVRLSREKCCKDLQLPHSRPAPRAQSTDWRCRPV